METSNKTQIIKDLKNKKLKITREFDAPVIQVWDAWTQSELLDQWWAPKPWKAKTKSMDFREGGFWIYAMVGPDGSEQWCRVDYENIEPSKSFAGTDAFCDEKGNINHEMPVMHWKCIFNESTTGTSLQIDITFKEEADIAKIVEMGFEKGFTAALTNLDELLENKINSQG